MEVSPRGHWSKSRVLYGGTLDNLGGGIVKKKLGGRHLKIVDMLDSNEWAERYDLGCLDHASSALDPRLAIGRVRIN